MTLRERLTLTTVRNLMIVVGFPMAFKIAGWSFMYGAYRGWWPINFGS